MLVFGCNLFYKIPYCHQNISLSDFDDQTATKTKLVER